MSKIKEGVSILHQLGFPRAQLNDRSALTLLTLLNLKPDMKWSDATKRPVIIHDILEFVKENYGINYAENTRETIRRQTIHQFEQAGLVIKNYDDPSRPTNSPKTNYIISDEALHLLKTYNTPKWDLKLKDYIKAKGTLIERYEKRKKDLQIKVETDESPIYLSPGKHNELQADILQKFRPTFCPDCKVVYVGDTAMKLLSLKEDLIEKINIPITQHDKLPDVVLYDVEKNLLFLIEAVTSHGPLSPKRQIELEETLKDSPTKRIYISAFPDFSEFKKHANDIAWDTEIWISENPNHMIHFNGPQFFTVYK